MKEVVTVAVKTATTCHSIEIAAAAAATAAVSTA